MNTYRLVYISIVTEHTQLIIIHCICIGSIYISVIYVCLCVLYGHMLAYPFESTFWQSIYNTYKVPLTYTHTRTYLSNSVMIIYIHTLRVCVLIKFKVLSKLKMYLDLKISYIWTDKQSWLNARIC